MFPNNRARPSTSRPHDALATTISRHDNATHIRGIDRRLQQTGRDKNVWFNKNLPRQAQPAALNEQHGHNASENEIIQQCIRDHDPAFARIIHEISEVKLVTFNKDSALWNATKVHGSLFIYQRQTEPKHGIIILSRSTMENWSILLRPELTYLADASSKFLVFPSDNVIPGVCFKSAETFNYVLNKVLMKTCGLKFDNFKSNFDSRDHGIIGSGVGKNAVCDENGTMASFSQAAKPGSAPSYASIAGKASKSGKPRGVVTQLAGHKKKTLNEGGPGGRIDTEKALMESLVFTNGSVGNSDFQNDSALPISSSRTTEEALLRNLGINFPIKRDNNKADIPSVTQSSLPVKAKSKQASVEARYNTTELENSLGALLQSAGLSASVQKSVDVIPQVPTTVPPALFENCMSIPSSLNQAQANLNAFNEKLVEKRSEARVSPENVALTVDQFAAAFKHLLDSDATAMQNMFVKAFDGMLRDQDFVVKLHRAYATVMIEKFSQ